MSAPITVKHPSPEVRTLGCELGRLRTRLSPFRSEGPWPFQAGIYEQQKKPSFRSFLLVSLVVVVVVCGRICHKITHLTAMGKDTFVNIAKSRMSVKVVSAYGI